MRNPKTIKNPIPSLVDGSFVSMNKPIISNTNKRNPIPKTFKNLNVLYSPFYLYSDKIPFPFYTNYFKLE
jgi:hypothetical protein